MWPTNDFGLALAWLSPILLGFMVAFVLGRMHENEPGGNPARKEAVRESATGENGFELAWSNVLSVGVQEMDEEHRTFIGRVNGLNKAVIEYRDKATIRRLMDGMLVEAANHFKNEERLLLEWSYPDSAAHAAKHAQLMQQLHRVKSEFETPAISFLGALKGLQINQLLIDHLFKEDMKYRDFLRARANPRMAPQETAVRGA